MINYKEQCKLLTEKNKALLEVIAEISEELSKTGLELEKAKHNLAQVNDMFEFYDDQLKVLCIKNAEFEKYDGVLH